MPFVFTGGTYAVAAQVDSDFTVLYGWVNGGSAIWADASRAFTAIPSGPSSDPTSNNQFARKAYVDQFLYNFDTGTVPAASLGISFVVPATVTPNGSGEFNLVPPQPFPTIMDICIPFCVNASGVTANVISTSKTFAVIQLITASTGAAHTTATAVGGIFVGR